MNFPHNTIKIIKQNYRTKTLGQKKTLTNFSKSVLTLCLFKFSFQQRKSDYEMK